MTEKTIILGSASPRRRELLAQIGAEFEVRVSNKEEVYHSNVPEEIVKELALMKAENVAEELAEENPAGAVKSTVVIGADTIVVQDGKILGKPADEADAVRMLTGLQGRRHDVYTGVAVLDYDENGEKHVYNYPVGTAVYVNEMTEEEIRAYVETKDPLDKAGAYGIQGRFAAHIDRIEGDYYNVVGLPVSRVYRTLRKLGVL
ncbi:MAG TPA: septum formation protein Maf [Candidatus Mediterraneibacter guildfordensis]|nr:septum formation protein Maf [Candidatus Mediterraneibacter guildfordensis]